MCWRKPLDQGLGTIRRNVPPFPRDLVLLQVAIPGTIRSTYKWIGAHDAIDPGSRCGYVTDRVGTYPLPESKVIVCTVHPNPRMIEEAFATGPEGFVQKQSVHADLAAAIHAVHAGDSMVKPQGRPDERRVGRGRSRQPQQTMIESHACCTSPVR